VNAQLRFQLVEFALQFLLYVSRQLNLSPRVCRDTF
jgi:hypothetical protein